MEIGEHGPSAPAAGARYCRAARRRGAVPWAALTVRHGHGGMVLVRARAPVAPAVRPRRGVPVLALAAALAALAALAVSVTLLLAGVPAGPAGGACPARVSATAHAGGHRLLVRAEPPHGTTSLLHLCADPTIGPVRAWSVRTTDDQPIAVLRTTASEALAAAPPTGSRRTPVTVVVIPETGAPLSFAVPIAVG